MKRVRLSKWRLCGEEADGLYILHGKIEFPSRSDFENWEWPSSAVVLSDDNLKMHKRGRIVLTVKRSGVFTITNVPEQEKVKLVVELEELVGDWER